MTEKSELAGFQRQWLRGKAHSLKPVVQVGQSGLADSVLEAVVQALLDHELIKVRLQQPDDKKGMAQDLAFRSGSTMCGLVGHTVILYRPHPEEPQIRLPERQEE
ncbi:MAG: ribosome assembly RNA-binding protein YhbY [Myxococcota bacterium]